MEIQFGEGGADSKIFVHELFSSYVKYAESLKLKVEILHSSKGSVLASIKGKEAGRAFQNESGKHACQRVPPTETKGRRQTSLVSVSVLPMPDKSVALIPDKDIEVTTQRGHGCGGQHQNKTDSAVRMKHLPTEISVFINGKCQHKNRRKAKEIITARVQQHYLEKKHAARNNVRKEQLGGGSRGDKIRTYNFIQSRAVDHRTGKKVNVKQVIDKGKFELLR